MGKIITAEEVNAFYGNQRIFDISYIRTNEVPTKEVIVQYCGAHNTQPFTPNISESIADNQLVPVENLLHKYIPKLYLFAENKNNLLQTLEYAVGYTIVERTGLIADSDYINMEFRVDIGPVLVSELQYISFWGDRGSTELYCRTLHIMSEIQPDQSKILNISYTTLKSNNILSGDISELEVYPYIISEYEIRITNNSDYDIEIKYYDGSGPSARILTISSHDSITDPIHIIYPDSLTITSSSPVDILDINTGMLEEYNITQYELTYDGLLECGGDLDIHISNHTEVKNITIKNNTGETLLGKFMPDRTSISINNGSIEKFNVAKDQYFMIVNSGDLYINNVLTGTKCLEYNDITNGAVYTFTRKKTITIKNNATRGTLTLSGSYSTTISQGASKTITINNGSSTLQFELSGASSSAQYQVTGGGADYNGYGTYSLAYSSITNNGTITVSNYTPAAPSQKTIEFTINSRGSRFKVISRTGSNAILDQLVDVGDGMPVSLQIEDGGSIEVHYLEANATYTIGSISTSSTFLTTQSDNTGFIGFALNSITLSGYDWSSLNSIFVEQA